MHIRKLLNEQLFKSAELLCGSFDVKTGEQLILYADALFGLQQYRRALQYYTQASDLTIKGKEEVKEKMGQCYVSLGQEKEALRTWELIPTKIRSLLCHLKMGELYLKHQRPKNAIHAYQSALALQPLAIEASIALIKLGVDPKWTSPPELEWLSILLEGYSNCQTYQLRPAIKIFSDLSDSLPHNVDLLLLKGETQLQVMDSGAALETLQRARNLDSLNSASMDTLAIIAHKKNYTDLLRDISHQLLTISDRSPETWIASALYLESTNQKDRALQCADKAIILNPRHVNALLVKGYLLVSVGQSDQAVKYYRMAYDIEKNLSVYEGLVEAYLAANDFKAEDFKCAMLTAKEAIQLMPRNPRALTLVGRVLAPSTEQRSQASKAFNKALAIDPEHFDAIFQLAKLHCEMKQFGAAIALLEKHLAHRGNELVHVKLGQIYVSQGEIEQALAHFHKALVLCPNYELALKGIERLESSLKGTLDADEDGRDNSFEEVLYD